MGSRLVHGQVQWDLVLAALAVLLGPGTVPGLLVPVLLAPTVPHTEAVGLLDRATVRSRLRDNIDAWS